MPERTCHDCGGADGLALGRHLCISCLARRQELKANRGDNVRLALAVLLLVAALASIHLLGVALGKFPI